MGRIFTHCDNGQAKLSGSLDHRDSGPHRRKLLRCAGDVAFRLQLALHRHPLPARRLCESLGRPPGKLGLAVSKGGKDASGLQPGGSGRVNPSVCSTGSLPTPAAPPQASESCIQHNKANVGIEKQREDGAVQCLPVAASTLPYLVRVQTSDF